MQKGLKELASKLLVHSTLNKIYKFSSFTYMVKYQKFIF